MSDDGQVTLGQTISWSSSSNEIAVGDRDKCCLGVNVACSAIQLDGQGGDLITIISFLYFVHIFIAGYPVIQIHILAATNEKLQPGSHDIYARTI